MSYLGLFGARDIDDHGLGFSVWCQGYESCSYLGLFGARDIDDHSLGFSVWCQGYESCHT